MNYQLKFREIVYVNCLEIYKKCFKITLNKNKIVKIKFDRERANNIISEKFIKNLSYEILQNIPITNTKILIKILKKHFSSKMFLNNLEKINNSFKIKDDKNVELLINPAKELVLKKVYNNFELDKLEAKVFSISNYNTFSFFLKKNKKFILQNLGLLLILTFILWLSNL